MHSLAVAKRAVSSNGNFEHAAEPRKGCRTLAALSDLVVDPEPVFGRRSGPTGDDRFGRTPSDRGASRTRRMCRRKPFVTRAMAALPRWRI
jgi:hypothetical protein